MDTPDNKQIWREVLESVKVSVSSAIFSTWFSQTYLATVNEQNGRFFAEIGCNSSFVKTTIENRYFGLIQDSLSKSFNSPCDIVFIVKQNPDLVSQKQSSETPLFENKKTSEDLGQSLRSKSIREGFTFENFAVSSSNQMAWAAAQAVTKSPGISYNPLFLWGGVGVGKTHLMNAVAYSILETDNNSKILFCTGEAFTNDIVEGIRNKTTPAFRKKYRSLKALFIDDIQFIAGKDASQEEFFHTFNTLVGSGAQIVLTSDRHPSEISKLEERLRSRFEAGLIVDISPPDFELRCAILQIKTKERGLEVPMDLIQLIAGNLDSARKIEGFLVRLFSETKWKETEITQSTIESILGKGSDTNGQLAKTNPNDLIASVSKYFSLGKRALLGASRERSVARPRQILMYLLRKELALPLEEVGRLIGDRDHTTVMHAVNKITHLTSSDVQIREDIKGIKSLL